MAKAKQPSVKESWTRITNWLRSKPEARDMADKLLPGAPDKAIVKLEKGLKAKLPADLSEFWQICGGSRPEEGADESEDEAWWQPGEWSSDIFPRSRPETMGFSVLSPRAALDVWQRLQEWDEFDRQLLPIAGDGGGDYQCVNISVKSGTHYGEVVEWSPEEEGPKVLASSLAAFLQQLAEGLEKGTITYQTDNGLVHRK
jgi:cell wall assembly regulator SMI1